MMTNVRVSMGSDSLTRSIMYLGPPPLAPDTIQFVNSSLFLSPRSVLPSFVVYRDRFCLVTVVSLGC